MQLLHYIHGYVKAAEREKLAKRAGTTVAYLLQLAYGYKRASVQKCIAIEKATKGAVRCETLRPDIDWAYLKTRK